MFEKVNPMHPDKVADRIAGALVDLAYSREENPKVAVEVLIGHGYCYVIAESSVEFKHEDVEPAVTRIVGKPLTVRLLSIPQDAHLAQNQADGFRCGDNGIFKGTPVTREQQVLTSLAHTIYGAFPTDGKYVGTMDGSALRHTICQSNATEEQLTALYEQWAQQFLGKDTRDLGFGGILRPTINPLGEWTGGPDVDTGATNRKLGSDMGDSVTGGGLMGKDLSKADVSVNIACFLRAQHSGQTVTAACAIGDKDVTFVYHAPSAALGDAQASLAPHSLARGFTYPDGHSETQSFSEIVEQSRLYILTVGGFERFAEWGLIRHI